MTVRRCALVLLVLSGAARAEPLLWPLDLQPALSSTFGETRSTAFHMGIDLKTWGKTGYAVRAVGDGWIHRVRTSPWGYGRALYQTLSDGRIVVYAHLESFAKPVQQRVLQAQRTRGHYSVQLWLDEGDIPVRRGQVIAHTGASGAGPPHLHVELRDADNVPMNPLLHGLGPVQDATPPTMRRLLVVPLSEASLVDDWGQAVSVPLKFADGVYRATRTVSVWGPIGLAVDSHDRADLAPNKMAALGHELHVDGSRVLTSTFERVSWSDGHLVALDRLRPTGDAAVYTALFRRPGNRLPFYDVLAGSQGLSEDGAVVAGDDGLQEGRHEIAVHALDVAGNRSVATLLIDVTPPAGMAPVDQLSSAPGLTADGIDFALDLRAIARPRHVLLQVKAPKPLLQAPRVEALRRTIPMRRRGPDEFVGILALGQVDTDSVVVEGWAVAAGGRRGHGRLALSGRSIRPGQAQRISLLAGEALLETASGSSFERVYPQAQRLQPVASDGLVATAVGCRVGPADVAFDARARIWLRASGPTTGLGVYADDGKGRWVLIGAEADSSAPDQMWLGAQIRAFGSFALMRDTTPPTIDNLQPADGSQTDADVVITAAIADAGSGIAREEDIELQLDGVRLISEYDPEAGTVMAQTEGPLRSGPHRLLLTLRDAAGNETAATSDFLSR